MESILRYLGKRKIKLINDVANSTKYCEPFSGSYNAGILLKEDLYKGEMILNDLDVGIYNFWECLKNDYSSVFKQCIALENKVNNCNTKDEIKHVIQVEFDTDNKYKKAACEYIYRYLLTIKGEYTSKRKNIIMDELAFYINSMYLQSIELSNNDYRECIRINDSDSTFMMIDPPYSVKNVDSYYRCNSSEFNHDELCEIVKNMKSKVLLLYNYTEDIANMYKQFNISIKSKMIYTTRYNEMLIRNY